MVCSSPNHALGASSSQADGEQGRPCSSGRPLTTDQDPPSYLNESSSLTRYVSGLPASICASCSTTRATRRSRNVRDASSMAAAVARSQDSLLVPTSVTTLYTLSSAMPFSLRASTLAGKRVTTNWLTTRDAPHTTVDQRADCSPSFPSHSQASKTAICS